MEFLSRWLRRRRPLTVDLDTPTPDPVPRGELPPESRVSLSARVTSYTDPDDPATLLWTTVTATLTGAPMGFRVAIPADQLPALAAGRDAPVELWLTLQVRPAPDGDDLPFDRQNRHGHWPASDDPFAQLARSEAVTGQLALDVLAERQVLDQVAAVTGNPAGVWAPRPAAWADTWEDPLISPSLHTHPTEYGWIPTDGCPGCYPAATAVRTFTAEERAELTVTVPVQDEAPEPEEATTDGRS